MKSIVLAMAFLCVLFSANPAEARRHHGGRLPWCGIYMGKYFGKSDRSLWVARNWAREGSNAGGPAPGVVVVWPHHVGVIVGRGTDGEWIVHSGNDGNAIRTRARSLRGAIAFRSVGAGASAYADLKGQEQATRRRDKHLVALAVEGGHAAAPTTIHTLHKSRTATNITSEPFAPLWHAAALTPPTDRADEPVRKKRKPVMKRERVLVSLFAPMSEAVSPPQREKFSIHADGPWVAGALVSAYAQPAAGHNHRRLPHR